MKQCTECKRYLTLNKFFSRKDRDNQPRSQCKDCMNKSNLARYHACDKANRKKVTYKYNLKVNYGLSVEDYNNLFFLQQGKCAICEKLLSNRFLDIEGEYSVLDHCHKTGKNRNILCSGCNTGLGSFNDNVYSLNKASKYLENHSI